MKERDAIAKLYKERSDESFAAAQCCLSENYHRASINRSWYSVFQLLTAATYVVLETKKPPNDQLNWNHKIQGNLFEEIAQKRTGVPRELFAGYTNDIRRLYEKREEADYRVDKEDRISKDVAMACLDSAKRIRTKVLELVGEWPC